MESGPRVTMTKDLFVRHLPSPETPDAQVPECICLHHMDTTISDDAAASRTLLVHTAELVFCIVTSAKVAIHWTNGACCTRHRSFLYERIVGDMKGDRRQKKRTCQDRVASIIRALLRGTTITQRMMLWINGIRMGSSLRFSSRETTFVSVVCGTMERSVVQSKFEQNTTL